MDDISKLQKINSVARELMKHGQASSMDEAVQKATQQIESGSVLEQQPMQEQAQAQEQPMEQQQEPAQEQAVEEARPESAPEPEPAPDMQEHPAEQVMEQPQPEAQSPDVAQKLAEMDNKINGLIAEMTVLKDEFRKLKESPVTPPLKPKQAKEGQTQFKQESQPAPAPKPATEERSEGHARSGKYKPDDVSIEKFFYYGNK